MQSHTINSCLRIKQQTRLDLRLTTKGRYPSQARSGESIYAPRRGMSSVEEKADIVQNAGLDQATIVRNILFTPAQAGQCID